MEMISVRTRRLSVKLLLPPVERKMDQNEEVVQASGSKTLLVRHLPEELSQDEKEDLLKYFGAQSVRVFSNRGRMVSGDSSYSSLLVRSLSPRLTAFFLTPETRCICHIWKQEIGCEGKILTCQICVFVFLKMLLISLNSCLLVRLWADSIS